LQNSLDARLAADQPVRVKIAFGDIPTAIIPGVNELRARIHCLAGKNQYSQATIKRMQEAIEVETVKYISFEDSQTKGVTGAQNGQSNDPNDTFGVYAYNKGVHGVESDPEKEKVRGGSHGIGKIASNSASDIYLIFRTGDFVLKFLEAINELGLSEKMKAKIPNRPDLGADERYGRRVLAELNQSYPVVLVPMLNKTDLKTTIQPILGQYEEGEIELELGC
ncbi:MAG: hypothetical protein ACRDD4_06620, partial [Culicoidibacterales bacterium]